MEEREKTPELTPRVPSALAKVIEVGARMNQVVPEGVALGGAVCALYAQHRLSLDIDFVLENLRGQFDEVRDRLLDQPGWQEARIRPQHLILGSLDEVEVGFRQLRRKTPIETQRVPTEKGPLTIPTFEEMLRIKAFLEVIQALVHCEPRDLDTQGFETFRFLDPRLKNWQEVKAVCHQIGQLLADKAIRGQGDAP